MSLIVSFIRVSGMILVTAASMPAPAFIVVIIADRWINETETYHCEGFWDVSREENQAKSEKNLQL